MSTSPSAAPLPWASVDSVFLDMDGTLLDLHFDNHFWLEYLPRRYGEARGLDPAQARSELMARYAGVRGTLDWYCLDYWRQELDMDIIALKREMAHLIAVHEHVPDFLAAVRRLGRRLVLVTNAHRGGLDLKLTLTALEGHFHRVVCAHELGRPKEDSRFWDCLQGREPFDPRRTLFVDDNLDVLRSAERHGIAHLRAVRRPDTRAAEVDTGEFAAIRDFRDLMPE
ncbi:GMP/IMP nucleotidase [Ectothiorhodospira shaposhnikovii]|uniref:GMP/IMP nucleotidase n=1 Tax=Ectothiorhodospira shaposhnikovii TaxID=1054 RepID=UPI00190892A0|nr:GMP/IMP nucleotidase [Ectothiorhodospira shaposhnikovii]